MSLIGCWAAFVSEITATSACLPGSRVPICDSRPRALAPPRVAVSRTSFASINLAEPSRLRAAERLKALGHEAAAPAVAAALHAETESSVQVALLNALATLAKVEAVPVVAPLLTSAVPEVRVAALKALLSLDPSQAAPHLSAAMKDPNRAVRRRASLLALGLSGPEALVLGADGIRDSDADVRAVAALVLAASGAEKAKHLLFGNLHAPKRAFSQQYQKAASTSPKRVAASSDRQKSKSEVSHSQKLPKQADYCALRLIVQVESSSKY